MKKFIKKQSNLFGLIIDPISYIVISLVFLVLGISMIYTIPYDEIIMHTIIGFALLVSFRLIALVYNQNWKKFPIMGIVRLAVSEFLACIIHYYIQYYFVVNNHIPFISLLAISCIDLFVTVGARMAYYVYFFKKSSNKLLLSSPTTHKEEMQYVQEAFDKNWVAPLGFNCDGFEEEMVDYLDENVHAFATVSGTSAIHLAIKLADVKPGDSVLCSDLTFAATVNPALYEGAKPVFVDSEYDTWNMDPKALEKAFEKYPNAKVVILVHLYGTPAKMDEIIAICKKHNAVLIEDSAEALGATYKGQRCGTFGRYNVLSFNGNKIITTSGGGMLLTKEKKDRDKAVFWSTQSREDAPWYEHEEIGYNYRMSNVIAGIGRGQLKHLEEHKKSKEKIYNRYKDNLRDLPVDMNPYQENTKPNFWLSCLTIKPEYLSKCKRNEKSFEYVHEEGKCCPDELAKVLRDNNIETRPIWKPMHMQPIFKDNDFVYVADKPVSEDIFERGICLPSDIKMTTEQQKRVIRLIKSCIMSLQVYTLDDSERWDEIVKSFKDYDIYYLSGYLKCLKTNGDGEPLLFFYEDGECRGINVVLKRDISLDERFKDLQKDKYYDLTSPYGYGGWIVEGENYDKLFETYTNWCKENNIISEFVRFHPLIDNQKYCEKHYNIVPLGQVISMNCESKEVIWSNMSSKNRNQVKKSNKEGVTINIGGVEKLDTFIKIYENTMQRNGAEDYYFFDKSYYECLFENLKNNTVIFSADYKGQTISSAIIFHCNGKASYHLSGSTRLYNGLCEAQNLLFEVANWANENGCKSFLLGGGVGSKKDSLYSFKKEFNKKKSYQFYIGKKIHNEKVYNELVNMRKDIANSNFFPKYRG